MRENVTATYSDTAGKIKAVVIPPYVHLAMAGDDVPSRVWIATEDDVHAKYHALAPVDLTGPDLATAIDAVSEASNLARAASSHSELLATEDGGVVVLRTDPVTAIGRSGFTNVEVISKDDLLKRFPTLRPVESDPLVPDLQMALTDALAHAVASG